MQYLVSASLQVKLIHYTEKQQKISQTPSVMQRSEVGSRNGERVVSDLRVFEQIYSNYKCKKDIVDCKSTGYTLLSS